MSSYFYINSLGMYLFYIRTNGELYGDGGGTTVTTKYGIRPVINLKADVKFSGSGTISDPYVIITE